MSSAILDWFTVKLWLSSAQSEVSHSCREKKEGQEVGRLDPSWCLAVPVLLSNRVLLGKTLLLALERGSSALVHVPGKAVKQWPKISPCLALSHWHLIFSLLVVTPVTAVLGKGFCGTEGASSPLRANSGAETCSEQSRAASSSAACEQAGETGEFQKNVIYTATP